MYAHDILADGPLHYYRMRESGIENPMNEVDHSNLQLGGTYRWGVPGPLRTSNHTPRALRHNGTDVKSVITSRQSLTGDQTRLAWVRTTSTDSSTSYPGNPALTIMGDQTNDVWDGFGVHDGKLRFTRFNGAAWQTFDSTQSVNDDRWHLLAADYNSSTGAVRLFVDGAQDGGGTVTAHQAQGGVDRIGHGFGQADWFSGDLAEIAIWNKILDANRHQTFWLVGRRRLIRVGILTAS